MRNYPTLHVEWVPASDIAGQELQVSIPGFAPSGTPYVTETLGAEDNQWTGFVPMWDKDGNVWSKEHRTNEATVTISSVRLVDGNAFTSETVSTVIVVDDLNWIPDAPADISAGLGGNVEIKDYVIEDAGMNVLNQLNREFGGMFLTLETDVE